MTLELVNIRTNDIILNRITPFIFTTGQQHDLTPKLI